MDTYERVHEYLRKLGLNTTGQVIDNYLENSKDKSIKDILDDSLKKR
jgi:hypothetical protein